MTNKEQWPEGATHKIKNTFKKWIDGVEYSLGNDISWHACGISWSLDEYLDGGYKIIERPEESAQYMPEMGDKIDVLFNEVDIDNLYGVIFIAEHGNEYWIKDDRGYSGVYEKGDYKIIKHKSERDVFIEKSIKATGAPNNWGELFGSLYDNGFKSPEAGEKC